MTFLLALAAQVAEQNSRSLYVLTIMTVLALPINILAGLFGMNVGGVPLVQDPSGFWIVVAMVATLTLVAAWLVFFRRRERNIVSARCWCLSMRHLFL